MTVLQRAILIVAGIVIAVVQLAGIDNNGLDESQGWAFALLIAAALLFIGVAPSLDFLTKLRTPPAPPPTPPSTMRATPIAAPPRPAPVRPNPAPTPRPDKYQYGIHISELDIAISAHEGYAEQYGIYSPAHGNGQSLRWNCGASIYASIRLAKVKGKRDINWIVWNSIVAAVENRMSADDTEEVGDPRYEQRKEAARRIIARIDRAVDEAVAGKGGFQVQPIARVVAEGFGVRGAKQLEALSAAIIINAETANRKILPELLEDFS